MIAIEYANTCNRLNREWNFLNKLALSNPYLICRRFFITGKEN